MIPDLTNPVNHGEIGGKYRILARLGQGGTADVSLAVARGPSGFNKLVVLKAMKSSLRHEPDFAKMFMNEARLAARLNHSNIVQTNEVFEHDGIPVIVMEYLEGQPLSAILMRARETNKFPLKTHLRVISETLSGLHYSHCLTDFDGTALNVVHRDVSPHNVFVTFDGRVKLLDFGIAKLKGSRVETATGVIKGKLRYMPPEQVTSENVDRRTDVFAVGVMMWEAATGAKMWSGLNEAAIMNHLLNGELTPPSEINPDVAPELERIILRSLAPDQEDRYASAAELQKDLEGYLDTLGPALHAREVGNLLEELFADERDKTRRVVEGQLSKVASLSTEEFAEIRPVELHSTTHSGTGTGSGFAAGSRTLTAAESRARGWLIYGSLGLAAIGIGALVWSVTQPRPVTVQQVSAPTAQAPTQSKVRITAFPATAKLYLNDHLLPSNPYSKMMDKDKVQYELRAEAPGFETETRTVNFDQDTELVLTLREKPKKKPVVQKDPPKSGTTPRRRGTIRNRPPPRRNLPSATLPT